MVMRTTFRLFALIGTVAFGGSAGATVIADFDTLATEPALSGSSGFPYANGGSSDYLGVTWDSRLNVTGLDYRVDTVTPGPPYGIPHSGNYFIGNFNGADDILLQTNQVLLGAWFARNEYYGYGGGADQVTITAFSGGGDLLSLSYDLPELLTGLPESPSFFDTSAFDSLFGITGYRISRRATGPYAADWVADDFEFSAPHAIEEPGPITLFAAGLLLVRWRRTMRTGAHARK